MTLEEVAASLPNGFHDAYIKGISIDYVSGTASFDLELWVGDDSAERKEEREVYRDARVTLSDLLFCVIEPPDSRYPYYDKKTLWVDGGPWNSAPPSTSIQLPSPLPENSFVYWFFVDNWNSFIYVGAMAARLEYVDSDVSIQT